MEWPSGPVRRRRVGPAGYASGDRVPAGHGVERYADCSSAEAVLEDPEHPQWALAEQDRRERQG